MKAISHDEPTFLRLTEERVFAQALRQRYLELATNAYDRADFERSDFYSLRSIMAVEGKLADPGITDGGDRALGAARIRLLNSFANGSRVGAPDLAARAQAAYDCWWLESQPGGDAAIASACATNAGTALAELEVIGTGTRVAEIRAEPQQYVVNKGTPSQTFEAGGATIQIINQPMTIGAPAPSHSAPGYAAPAAPQANYEMPAMQQRAALARTMQGIEPMESISSRAFVVEAPAPIAPTGYAGYERPMDTVVPTVPYQEAFDPIDLIPDYEGLPYSEAAPVEQGMYEGQYEDQYAGQYEGQYGGQYEGQYEGIYEGQGEPLYDQRAEQAYGGQYMTFEQDRQSVTSMAPIYDDTMGGQQVAALQAPVYSDMGAMPMTAAPQMMDMSGDVLSSLVGARSGGGSDFSVYFGFDSDVITPEGEDVLADTVERLILEDRNTVALMGFTDSAGDSRYNQLLAMRRANAVRSFIQQRANKALRFRIMPVGEAEAVKQGGDGVTEALNRRVEIMLQ